MFVIRWMFRLFIGFVVLVVIAAVVGNYFAQSAAQHAAASRIRTAAKAEGVTVRIHSTPFLWDALVDGKMDAVDITADGVPVGPLDMTEVQVDADRVKYSLSGVIRHHTVDVTSIAKATVTLTLTNAGLSTTLKDAGGTVELRGGDVLALVLHGRVALSVDLTKSSLIPACVYHLTTLATGYSLTCTVSPVPASLLGVLSSAHAA